MEKGSAKSKGYLLLGGLALVAVVIVVAVQSPPRHPNSGPSGPSSAPAMPGKGGGRGPIAALGPVRVGETVGDGFRVDRIEGSSDEVRVILSRGGKTLTLGLASPEGRTDTPFVPVPDLYVWYSGQAEASPELQALIEAVVAKLREAAEGKPLHARVLDWSASAPAATP